MNSNFNDMEDYSKVSLLDIVGVSRPTQRLMGSHLRCPFSSGDDMSLDIHLADLRECKRTGRAIYKAVDLDDERHRALSLQHYVIDAQRDVSGSGLWLMVPAHAGEKAPEPSQVRECYWFDTVIDAASWLDLHADIALAKGSPVALVSTEGMAGYATSEQAVMLFHNAQHILSFDRAAPSQLVHRICRHALELTGRECSQCVPPQPLRSWTAQLRDTREKEYVEEIESKRGDRLPAIYAFFGARVGAL